MIELKPSQPFTMCQPITVDLWIAATELGRVVQNPVFSSARFEFRFERFKSISVLILFVYKLMTGSSKNNRENYPRKCFWTQEKETRVNFNPGLSANRPSNNWALLYRSYVPRHIRLRSFAVLWGFCLPPPSPHFDTRGDLSGFNSRSQS